MTLSRFVVSESQDFRKTEEKETTAAVINLLLFVQRLYVNVIKRGGARNFANHGIFFQLFNFCTAKAADEKMVQEVRKSLIQAQMFHAMAFKVAKS